MVHELKILPEYFEKVVNGEKTFEIRKNDRNYKVGDTLVLKEWDKDYTGNEIVREVIYTLTDDSGYILTGYIIMSIK